MPDTLLFRRDPPLSATSDAVKTTTPTSIKFLRIDCAEAITDLRESALEKSRVNEISGRLGQIPPRVE
jgi:hypothetical protein